MKKLTSNQPPYAPFLLSDDGYRLFYAMAGLMGRPPSVMGHGLIQWDSDKDFRDSLKITWDNSGQGTVYKIEYID